MDNSFDYLMLTGLVLCIAVPIFAAVNSACVSAKIYNEQNKTNWTCSDFFWASDQINSGTQTIKLTE